MSKDEFFAAVDSLMEALVDAGLTDASPSASYRSGEDAVAEIGCILPDEVVKLTELIRRGASR